MKKKIIALMMVIPLVLMLTIFTISKAVSVTVDVPAESIKIISQNDDGFVAFDMATYNDDYIVEAKVFPEEAKNKNYTTTVVTLDEEEGKCLSLLENNKIVLNRTGLAEVVVNSNDKGFTDRIKVSVSSSKAYDMLLTAFDGENIKLTPSTESNIDYVYSATTGGEVKFNAEVLPKNLTKMDVRWDVDNKGLIINNYSGSVNKIFSGDYIVSATLKDGIKGDIVKNIKVSLEKPEGIVVNGKTDSRLMLRANSNMSKFYVETDSSAMELYDADIICSDAESVNVVQIKPNCYSVELVYNKTFKEGETTQVEIINNGQNKKIELEATNCLRNVTSTYDNGSGVRQFLQKNNATTRYHATIEPAEDAVYTWSTISNNIKIIPIDNGNSADIVATDTGLAEFTVTTVIGSEQFNDTYKVLVVDSITNPTFNIEKTKGIKDIPTIATHNINNGTYNVEETILGVSDGNNKPASNNILHFESSDNGIVKIDDNGKLEVLKDGIADVYVSWKYNNYFNEKNVAKTTIQVSKDAVYVNDSTSLLKATDDGKKIVLQNDIYFAKDFKDDQIESLLQQHKMPTTFDWNYYLNIERNDYKRPDVKYVLEFKNDVYGNGYKINTEAITDAKDGNNPKYFKGPLNFVAVEEKAAVKGQDNISFLVRTKGIKIDNVHLESIQDSKLLEENNNQTIMELNKLNNVGTTLEIMADNVKVINSRVKNGRTVVRVYSGNDSKSVISEFPLNASQIAQEKINVHIESCILSQAREFVLKIGSNRGVMCKPSKEGYKQYQFKNKNGTPFDYMQDIYNKNYVEGREVNDILLTDVTLKNSILDTSGLFSVGMESHFSGPFLTGEDEQFGNTLKRYGWWNLSATSYGAVLRLVGDVRIYDWKKVSNVDSSTLIESNGKGGETLSKIINLNIGKMIATVGNNPNYQGILSKIDDEDYVHGGIAFYGGGYNYSKLDTSLFSCEQFETYKVNINVLSDGTGSEEDLQGQMLPLAAGTEDFTFYMYNNNSKFNYKKQLEDFNDGSAYGWLIGVTQ